MGFWIPKRRQMKHLVFLTLLLESRRSMSPQGTEEVGSIPTAPTSFFFTGKDLSVSRVGRSGQ